VLLAAAPGLRLPAFPRPLYTSASLAGGLSLD